MTFEYTGSVIMTIPFTGGRSSSRIFVLTVPCTEWSLAVLRVALLWPCYVAPGMEGPFANMPPEYD